jgi:hypothetical protein
LGEWRAGRDSNPRPSVPKVHPDSAALPTAVGSSRYARNGMSGRGRPNRRAGRSCIGQAADLSRGSRSSDTQRQPRHPTSPPRRGPSGNLGGSRRFGSARGAGRGRGRMSLAHCPSGGLREVHPEPAFRPRLRWIDVLVTAGRGGRMGTRQDEAVSIGTRESATSVIFRTRRLVAPTAVPARHPRDATRMPAVSESGSARSRADVREIEMDPPPSPRPFPSAHCLPTGSGTIRRSCCCSD